LWCSGQLLASLLYLPLLIGVVYQATLVLLEFL
jgi:hypothetical protein